MKILFIIVLIVSYSKLSFASEYDFDNAIYLECNTCSTTSQFKQYGIDDFNNNFYARLNQKFAYTIVNHSEGKAYFIDITHKFRRDPESGYDLDVIIPYPLTDSTELHEDYELSAYVIRNSASQSNYSTNKNSSSQSNYSTHKNSSSPSNFSTNSTDGDIKVVTVSLDSNISAVQYTGVSSVASQISSELNSDSTLSSGWHKLAGRAIIIVEFNDGKLAAFFKGIYVTDMYAYLEGTAIKDDNSPAPVSMTGGMPISSGSGGATNGGRGSWTVTGGGGGGRVMACTSIDGGTPTCEWIRF